jgi:hypothetical protein
MTFVALRKISARFKRFYFQPVTDPQQGMENRPTAQSNIFMICQAME